jgi:hypothetical protein
MGCAQHRNKGEPMKVEVEVLPTGYRRATLVGPYGAFLLVRPDGSHAHSNVKEDSEIYAVLNFALFTSKG